MGTRRRRPGGVAVHRGRHLPQRHLHRPNVGHEGVAAYWAGVTSHQSNVEVQMGAPFVDGNRVAVEFWTKMAIDGDDATISGTLLLVLADDGRCRSLRENFNFAQGRQDPPQEWGG